MGSTLVNRWLACPLTFPWRQVGVDSESSLHIDPSLSVPVPLVDLLFAEIHPCCQLFDLLQCKMALLCEFRLQNYQLLLLQSVSLALLLALNGGHLVLFLSLVHRCSFALSIGHPNHVLAVTCFPLTQVKFG